MSESTEGLARAIYDRPADAERFLRGLATLDRRYAALIRAYRARAALFDEGDAFVITYGDQFQGEQAALRHLHRFLADDLGGATRGVHILPFCPYSSDAGFSVIDYLQVDRALGDWDDIAAIASDYTLMADLVCNHCSVQHRWFTEFLAGTAPYRDYFITADPYSDVTQVFRPRTSPLFHPFRTAAGERHVWTTFSADQVDLNYASPDLFLEMINALFAYIRHGARVIRLDAVAYLWKELGTPSIHHPKTHAAVQLLRTLVEERFANVLLITETNVPHADNISYFGDGHNEAHMVYNFSLPPLTLDAFVRGDAAYLTAWAQTLQPPSSACTFFNFLASHDGIGLLPASDYLSATDMAHLIATATERGGHVSYKQTAGGPVPYELNINYLSALTDPAWPAAQKAQAFLTAQAIMCALAGVPAPYIQSVIGSENWSAGPAQGLEPRSINRQKYRYRDLHAELAATGTVRQTVFAAYQRLLRIRARHPAFHPNAPQQIRPIDRRIFAVQRGDLLCLHNTSAQSVRCALTAGAPAAGATAATRPPTAYTDILTAARVSAPSGQVTVAPYAALWLESA